MAHVWLLPDAIVTNFKPPATGAGALRSVVVLSPRFPKPLNPQQYAALSEAIPHVCPEPAESIVKDRPPATGRGVALICGELDPVPSSPERLVPQQYAAPPDAIPQVWSYPIVIEAKCSPPVTATGTVSGLKSPRPSCPEPFPPQ